MARRITKQTVARVKHMAGCDRRTVWVAQVWTLRARLANKVEMVRILEKGIPQTRDMEKRVEMIETSRRLEGEADDIVSLLRKMGEEV